MASFTSTLMLADERDSCFTRLQLAFSGKGSPSLGEARRFLLFIHVFSSFCPCALNELRALHATEPNSSSIFLPCKDYSKRVHEEAFHVLAGYATRKMHALGYRDTSNPDF